MQGSVVEPPEDPDEEDEFGDKVNWIVYFEEDDTEVPMCLLMDNYSPSKKAPEMSWCVIKAAG
eukprot:3665366-Prymnesium_polylepis.2